ncbi:hypothetical protein CEQ90_20440 [Lewinellaceae bacterium SD302]|nr:hypothetical protein CEQ90_20440 [Lewinellaceae bacterium SD302]
MSTIKFTLIIFIAFYNLNNVKCQLIEEWNSSYDLDTSGVTVRYGTESRIDDNGNVYLYALNRLLKYSNAGELIWEKEFLGLAGSFHRGFRDNRHLELFDNYVYVLRTTESFRYNDTIWSSCQISKISDNGDEIWTQSIERYDTLSSEIGVSFTIDNESVYLLSKGKFPNGDEYKSLTKYDVDDGNEIWDIILDGSIVENSISIDEVAAKDNVIYLAGHGSYNNEQVYCIIKFDENGNIVWSNKYNPSYTNKANICKIVVIDNKIIVTGGDYATICVNENGFLLWEYQPTINLPDNIDSDKATDIELFGDRVYISGTHSEASGSGANGYETDQLTVCLDLDGELIWQTRYEDDEEFINYEIGYDIIVGANGDLYSIGYVSGISNIKRLQIVKYEFLDGQIEWVYEDTISIEDNRI